MIRVLVGTGVDPEVVKLFVQQLQARLDVQQPEIDETEAVPVLEDVPEDPEITIEQLNARILELEAELEEHKRSVDLVLEALRPLGTSAAYGTQAQAYGTQAQADARQYLYTDAKQPRDWRSL